MTCLLTSLDLRLLFKSDLSVFPLLQPPHSEELYLSYCMDVLYHFKWRLHYSEIQSVRYVYLNISGRRNWTEMNRAYSRAVKKHSLHLCFKMISSWWHTKFELLRKGYSWSFMTMGRLIELNAYKMPDSRFVPTKTWTIHIWIKWMVKHGLLWWLWQSKYSVLLVSISFNNSAQQLTFLMFGLKC